MRLTSLSVVLSSVLVVLLAFLCFSVTPAGALTTHPYTGLAFGPGGPGVGTFSNLQSVAVDQSTGDVYVYDDKAGGRIYKFDAAGQPVAFSALSSNVIENVGEAGASEVQVAVDSSTGPARGDVYVADGSAVRIYDAAGVQVGALSEHEGAPWGLPCGVAVDPAGDVYVGLYPNHVNKYVPVANPVTDGDYSASLTGVEEVCNVAADSEGNAYVDTWPQGPITKYEALQFGALEALGAQVDAAGSTTAVDPAPANDDVYVDEQSRVAEYDATGTLMGYSGAGGSGALHGSQGVALDHAGGELYAADGGVVEVFGPAVVLPDVALTEPELHATRVTFNGTVKLDEAGSAECFFEYGATSAYGETVPCEPQPVKESEEIGGNPVSVRATVAAEPDTTYFYRLRAVNASGIPSDEDGAELTAAGPGLHGESVSAVASTAATLGATIDPHGASTSYYFQYSTASTTGCPDAVTPVACDGTPPFGAEALGSGFSDQGVTQRLQGLAPGTVYHYRVVVVSEPETGPSEAFPEEDRTFTTQAPPTGFGLPDNRQWELVSPPDKRGALLVAPYYEGEAIAASVSGSAFTYLGTLPTEEDAPGYEFQEQIFSTRGPGGGWSSEDISLPHAPPAALSAGQGKEYRFFSEDLSLGLVEPFGEFTSLKPDVFPPDTERTPYLRHDFACSAEPGSCYEPLVTGAPGYADVPEGTTFGGENPRGDVEFVGASPDLAHVIVGPEKTSLTSGAPGGALYEWSAAAPASERLQLVSVLPGSGTPVVGSLGSRARAVSGDGSRVVWTGPSGLYLTDTQDGRSVLVASGSGATLPTFQIADREGSRVFFSDPQPLLAGAGANDLYECEIAVQPSGPSCTLHDVAPGAEISGGVLGASEDGSYVYFASDSVAGDGGEQGAVQGNCGAASSSASCNLYMAHYDAATRSWEAPVFIAALSAADYPDWSTELGGQTARVAPSGGWLAFMSARALTGYDNHDAHSGEPDEEVFLFDAAHRRLVCASCNPTGSRPEGIEVVDSNKLVTGLNEWLGTAWLAANVPGWTAYDLHQGQALHQSRYLSDEGRLFFNSSDALVPQAINHTEDVYEWEPAGVGSCAAGATGYSPATGGCVSLVSSGSSPHESAFLDASENGDDVFFLTAERLVEQDVDTAYDVYDAHLCTAASPCPAAPTSPPPCETADACRSAPAPQPEVFGAGPSETFAGPGNIAPTPSTAKAETRSEKLARARRACGRARSKKRRRACEAAARRRYGTQKISRSKPRREGK
jgi:hypothetical protein